MAEQARKVDPEELKAAFQRAAEIAAVVPESMQDAAFHRALDQILGTAGQRPDESTAPSRRAGRKPGKAGAEGAADDAAARLIHDVNRTAYPEIASASKVLDRALAVLRFASRDFAIDGLTAPEIAKVLTEKFRQRTTRQAVTQALSAAHTMVDTGRRGRTTVYRIMQPGEDFLEAGGSQARSGDADERRPPRRQRRKRRQPTVRSKAKSTAEDTRREAPAMTRGARRRGPKALVEELIDERFFDEPRTMVETQEQLRHKKGIRYTPQDLSPAFVRLLREGRLDRDRNASGQYEYCAR